MSDNYKDYFAARRVPLIEEKPCSLPPYLEEILPECKESMILDLGCGAGAILRGLQENGYVNVFGTDISSQAVSYCREDGLKVDLMSDIESYASECKRRYDLIIATHVIEHIKKDEAISFLKSIREHLLKEGGGLFLATPNAQALTGNYWSSEDFTHEFIYTSGSLYYALYLAGYRHIEFVDIHSYSHLKKNWKGKLMKLCRGFALECYRILLKITGSSIHAPSPIILTWEIKVLAR